MLPLIRIVEQIVPPTKIDLILGEHREREILRALQEEFGDVAFPGDRNGLFLPAIPPVKTVEAASLSELLVTVAKAKLAGKTIYACDDNYHRQIGFLVDEDDTLHVVGEMKILQAVKDGKISEEVLSAFGFGDAEKFLETFKTLGGRQELAGGDNPWIEGSGQIPDSKELDEKCEIFRLAVEAENEAVWKPVDDGILAIPRPDRRKE